MRQDPCNGLDSLVRLHHGRHRQHPGDCSLTLLVHQTKYLNHIVEQHHRAIKRVTQPMLGFKTFRCARIIAASIETMHMIRNRQLEDIKDQPSSTANPLDSLAF